MNVRRGKYYLVVYHSRVPVVLGNAFDDGPFQASTLGPIIFVPGPMLARRVEDHERNHIRWWWSCFAATLAVCILTTPPAVAWLLPLLAYFVAYSIAGGIAKVRGGDWYHDNWFERIAREGAGEPVE